MLKPHHKKALMLLRENVMSTSDIAKACNLSEGYLYQLIEGAPNAGMVGVEFQKEYKAILTECDKRTISDIKTLKGRIVAELLKWNASLPEAEKLNLKQVKAKKDILDSLAKLSLVDDGAPPIKTGLSGEDLVNEFKRIRSLVELAPSGRTRI